MTAKPSPPPVDLDDYDRHVDATWRNRRLLAWLEDPQRRAELFEAITARRGGVLVFPSRAVDVPEPEHDIGQAPAAPQTGYKPVQLITAAERVQAALKNVDGVWSNRVYAPLGGGSFMLALDPTQERRGVPESAHQLQRRAFHEAFPDTPEQLTALAHAACGAAAITSLRASEVDLAVFAEQSGLRMAQLLMGYAMKDYPLLQDALRTAYRGLVHQVMGRHFVVDPIAVPAAKQAMALLLRRTAELLDAYAAKDEDALEGCDDPWKPDGIEPMLPKLASSSVELNVAQRAIVAVGAVVGTVGNVQAAACLAIRGLFASQRPTSEKDGSGRPDRWSQARSLALSERRDRPMRAQAMAAWMDLLSPLLRDDPPIPYLPRWAIGEGDQPGGEVLLALGGATRSATSTAAADALVWGMPTEAPHWCAGMALAWPLVVEIVRQTMALPGLDQKLDPLTGEPKGLTQRWGFICESYPLTIQRERHRAQSSLNVAMRLKPPVRDSADRVRRLLVAGAPRIEHALREARHVHFAWFELIESDSVLVLHTVYDGPFSAYIQHFALRVGELFDALFDHIEDPPPKPVKHFPNEFVAHIQRYNRPPVVNYLFSAYPQSEVARIMRDEMIRQQRDERA